MEGLKLNQHGLTKLKRKTLSLGKNQNKSIVAINKLKKTISYGGAEIKSRGHNRGEEEKNSPQKAQNKSTSTTKKL